MCTRTDGKKVIPYFFPLLSSPLLHSFPSEKWKKEAAFDGQMFYFSFIIIDVGGQYNYVVMVVCAFPNAFFSFSTSILKVLTVLGDFPSIGKLQITSHFSLRRGKTENLLPLIAPGKALPKALLWLMAIRRLAVHIQCQFR